MIEIINNIPFYAWAFFLILLIGGLRARKPNSVHLGILFVIPAIFFFLTFYSCLIQHGNNFVQLGLALLSLILGYLVGLSQIQKLNVKFNKMTVEMPGSWMPLILSMSIFADKVLLGILTATQSDLINSSLVFSIELLGIFILGIFIGRGIGCLLRYRKTLNKPA